MDVTSTKADPLAAEYAALPFYKQGWFFQTLAIVGLIVPGDLPLIIVVIAIAVLWNQTTHVRSRGLFGGTITRATTRYKAVATAIVLGLLVMLAMGQEQAARDARGRLLFQQYVNP